MEKYRKAGASAEKLTMIQSVDANGKRIVLRRLQVSGGQGVHREVGSEGHAEKYRAVIEGATPQMNWWIRSAQLPDFAADGVARGRIGRRQLTSDDCIPGPAGVLMRPTSALFDHRTRRLERLSGFDPPQYRLRMGGQRFIFRKSSADAMEVLRVRNRREAYR